MLIVFFFFLFFSSPLFLSHFSLSLDTLVLNQTLLDNGKQESTLISAGQRFQFGFFGPSTSRKRYVGIWFMNIPEKTLVWVANKDNPSVLGSGVLSITPDGNIVLINKDILIWTTNVSSLPTPTITNPVLQLLDTGNLVLLFNHTSDSFLWQSFDHPGDTLLPGMKLGWDLKNNHEWYLTSSKTLQDPSTGPYTYHLDYRGLPQMLLLLQGSQVQYRSGPWDGVQFGGGQMKPNTVFIPVFVYDENNVYYTFHNVDESVVSRFMVSPSGLLQHLKWSITRGEWIVIATIQTDTCDAYATCGSYGICSVKNSQECWCPNGFTPRFPSDWYRLDWAGGCVPRKPLNCSLPTGFRMFSKVKLPDASSFMVNLTAVDGNDCEKACLNNCSCTAYAKTEVSGCVVWFGDLLDIRTYDEGGQDLYIRMSASELAQDDSLKRKVVITVAVAAGGGILLCLVCFCIFCKTISKPSSVMKTDCESRQELKSIGHEDFELPSFDLATISIATNDFSFTNKIGEGGFGPVYKGILSTGQVIAVKRLSKSSGQGLEEFKNEVILIAKLQHRNLVRLLGCCIHGEERMLVYEYMHNRSLDLIIFDEARGGVLDWEKHFQIIVGIARGLLYLHRDSRLRIIHRDLKTSNILLDCEMNPRISDFGLARTFGGDEHNDNTSRVMGTFGYMAPEYAIDGLFSVKSDVFSFGVLTLEIISGKKNRGFCHPDHDLNLLGHAWRLFNEGNPLKLVDARIGISTHVSQVLKCIHVALLCVQRRSEDRPTMSTVLLMLDSENPVLPPPTLPGFFAERSVDESDSSTTRRKPLGSNEMTVTLLVGR